MGDRFLPLHEDQPVPEPGTQRARLGAGETQLGGLLPDLPRQARLHAFAQGAPLRAPAPLRLLKCYVEHGSYKCPVCSKRIGNMTIFWRMLDAKLAGEVGQMPPEDANRTSRILCNDCGEKSTAPFHYVYHKCLPCGSYNTQAL